MAVIVNGDGILTGISSLATSLTDITSGRGTVTGVATVGTLQLGAGVSISSPRSQQAAIFTNNTEFLTVDDAGRVGVGTITPNSDAHPENEKKINVGFITAKSVAGDIDARNVVIAGVSTIVGNVSMGGGNLTFGDSSSGNDDRLQFGASTDLEIFHNGTNNHIDCHTAGQDLYIRPTKDVYIQDYVTDDKLIKMIKDGAVELYHDGTKMLETTADGATLQKGLTVRGIEGGEAQIRIEADEADNASDRFRLVATDSAGFFIQSYDGSQYDNLFGGYLNGASELYHNNSKKFETTSTGSQGTGIVKLISGNGSQSSDFSLLHLVAGGTADRGLKIGTGRATGASQNDGAVFYDAINSESNEYGSQHIFRRGGHNNMVIGYQSNNYVGIQQDYPGCALHVTDTNPVIAAFHHSDGSSDGDQARISLGALQNNPPYNRGVNLIAEYKNTGHDFVVACSANDSSGPAEVFRVAKNGDVTVPSGSIKLSESGQGINFHAHGTGSNISSNLLDDYEEGTFTPTQPTIGTNSASGHYTKIGRYVYASIFMTLPTNSSSVAFYIDSLPFTSLNNSGTNIHGGYAIYSTYGSPFTVRVHDNATRAQVSAIGGGNITLNGLDNLNFRIQVHYMTN